MGLGLRGFWDSGWGISWCRVELFSCICLDGHQAGRPSGFG